MNENSYFNPEDMRAQCDAAINNLEEDNRANGIIEEKIMEFITEHALAGKAFEAAKQQMLDYVAVLHAMKLANEADIADFRYLKLMSIGSEIDGSFILSEKEDALSERKINGEKAEKYRKKAQKEQSMLIRQQYMTKVAHYMAMEVINQELYNELQKEEEKYDAIESLTNGLFEQGTTIRLVVENALSSMQGAFQNGVYVPDMQAGWRGEISALLNGSKKENKGNAGLKENKVFEGDIPIEIENQLLKMGYTQGEINVLRQYGVSLNYNDICNLKLTVGTEKICRSEDARALMYNGKVYYIYVPKSEPMYDSIWKLDWKKVLTRTEFDLAAGTLGISLEDIPKEEINISNSGYKVQEEKISRNDKNATTASIMHLVIGMENFVVSALKHVEVVLVFESSGDSRRVTISVGDSQKRLEFQQNDYSALVNTYQSATDWMSQKYASDYAKGIYQTITGESVPDVNSAYTVTGTIDQQHRECNISGYLSYSETGKLLYTPLVLPGDSAYVAECMKYTGFFPKKILDFTDLLSNPVTADEKVRKILEEALEEK